jgi:lipopolysaccharide/colanic/teichoic acid biosynthesis glycosyltransferase
VSILAFLLTAVFVPMLVNEFTDWLPWFAARLVGIAARTLPPDVRQRYIDEWLAELDASPGKLSKFVVAVRIFSNARETATVISGVRVPSFKAMTVKALFDKLTAVSFLIVLAPLLVAIAISIKLADGGPVFARETRIGEDGQPFGVWKFRTMIADARTGEMRLTKRGAWLRRNFMDGLPQLINLLLGDISLVGPWPALYGDDMWPAARPGITGLWQVSGRSDLPWYEAVRLGQRYVDNWSLVLDLQILCKTCSAIIRRHDRY